MSVYGTVLLFFKAISRKYYKTFIYPLNKNNIYTLSLKKKQKNIFFYSSIKAFAIFLRDRLIIPKQINFILET